MARIFQTVMMTKLFRQKASRRPQNIGHKAAAAKRPHFAHSWPRQFQILVRFYIILFFILQLFSYFRYEETTCEVLLSVKRMEDSLKRLKRGKSSANLVGNMSDDDKIRTQIWLDIQQLTKQVCKV